MTIFINKTLNSYGIGKNKISKIVKSIGLNSRSYPKVLKLKQQSELEKSLKKVPYGKKLKESIKETISFLSKTKTYKGVRHKLGYPVRGQRTHTNAKTKKFKF